MCLCLINAHVLNYVFKYYRIFAETSILAMKYVIFENFKDKHSSFINSRTLIFPSTINTCILDLIKVSYKINVAHFNFICCK